MSIAGRLYLKLLWLKKTYSFYWAHKPLCKAYREDVIRINNIYLCRSCLFAYCGMILSFASLFIVPGFYAEYGAILLVALLLVALPLSYPTLYKRLPRRLRDACRFACGFVAVQIFHELLNGHVIPALMAILLSWTLWKVYLGQRSTRKIQLCATCNEYSTDKACPGYRTQMSLLREYEEEATEYLLSTGYAPKILK